MLLVSILSFAPALQRRPTREDTRDFDKKVLDAVIKTCGLTTSNAKEVVYARLEDMGDGIQSIAATYLVDLGRELEVILN
jgi:hypothetical protein